MTPTEKNRGELWWLDEGDGVLTVVKIDVVLHNGVKKAACWYIGYEIPERLDTMKDARWLGRAVPPEAKDDD